MTRVLIAAFAVVLTAVSSSEGGSGLAGAARRNRPLSFTQACRVVPGQTLESVLSRDAWLGTGRTADRNRHAGIGVADHC